MDSTPTTKSPNRLAYSVQEFAELFGHGKDWAYKMIYAGKVKRIPGFGAVLIPVTEVDRLLASANFMSNEGIKGKKKANKQ